MLLLCFGDQCRRREEAILERERERERDLTHLSLVKAAGSRPQKSAKRNIHIRCDPRSNFRAKYECKKPLQTGKNWHDRKSCREQWFSQISNRSLATLGCEEGKMHDRTGSVGEGSCSNKVPRSVVGR
jgi:hypothetical protein